MNVGNSPAPMHRRRWHLHATHLSTMSRTQTPPSALTPAVQLRPVAGARRAIPRRIHGARLAITSTARSERRITVRGPGVGIDASSASADPARGPWRSTAKSCQLPGTPRSSTLPRSSKPVPEPTTRSRTVLVQTSVAAGLSWYLAHDVLGHPQPFFAPIAAAVSLSISNVLRAQRAIQTMIGVTLGIGMGTLAQGLLGPGAIAIAVAALIALCAAVFIGHGYIGRGMMFANQTVISAILVLALYRTNVGFERIYDALIGGVAAIVFAVLLFPADPLRVLRSARSGVLGVLHGVLSRAADLAAGRREAPPDWPLSAVDRVHEQLGGLIEARTTARQVVRVAPRRWANVMPLRPPITRPYTSRCWQARCCNWPVRSLPRWTVAALGFRSPCTACWWCSRPPPPSPTPTPPGRAPTPPPRATTLASCTRAPTREPRWCSRTSSRPASTTCNGSSTYVRLDRLTTSRPGTPGRVSSAPASATPR